VKMSVAFYMANFIRAVFCIQHLLDFQGLQQFLETLAPYGCDPVGAPTSDGDWVEQKLAWRVQDAFWTCRLLQFSFGSGSGAVLSFDIDESLPFQMPGALSVRPGGEPWFEAYQQMLVRLIRQIEPTLGMLDYEADLLCGQAHAQPFASWGNYFPAWLLNRLSTAERSQLFRLVDEALPVDDLGVLTFIHPLMVNQAWSDRHVRLDRLVRSHFQ
jgi:hypothetical protein